MAINTEENLWKKHSDKIHKVARKTQDLIGVGCGHLGWVAQQQGRDDDKPTGIGFVLDGDKDKVIRGFGYVAYEDMEEDALILAHRCAKQILGYEINSQEDIARRITWFESELADADKSFDYWLNELSYLAFRQSEEMVRRYGKQVDTVWVSLAINDHNGNWEYEIRRAVFGDYCDANAQWAPAQAEVNDNLLYIGKLVLLFLRRIGAYGNVMFEGFELRKKDAEKLAEYLRERGYTCEEGYIHITEAYDNGEPITFTEPSEQ